MNIINENQLKHYIKKQVDEATAKILKDHESLWNHLNAVREEVRLLRHELKDLQVESELGLLKNG